VLNASLAGAILQAHHHPEITALYGARFGISGILEGCFIDLLRQSRETVQGIVRAPGSALGSSRRSIDASDYDRILDVLRRHDIRYLFYTGGNGSMGTALELLAAASASNYELRVIGIPKTIDNDLAVTDHTPGYASAARFFAHAVRDIGEDNRSLPSPITVVEVLGRNVGWIVAGTSLARKYPDDAPHLIYFPERGISADRLATDAESVFRRLGRVVIAACEGQKDEAGGWFGSALGTAPGVRDPLPANMGHTLARAIWDRIGVRARAEKPGLLGRSFALLASEVDQEESFRCGEEAVRAAVSGHSGVMVAIRRLANQPYSSDTVLVPLAEVARVERPFPSAWMNAEGNDVTAGFAEYATPLIGDVPAHPRFDL
jgi:6-phosphofructokinase 1